MKKSISSYNDSLPTTVNTSKSFFAKWIFAMVFMLGSILTMAQTITITQSSSGITATGYDGGCLLYTSRCV